MKNKRFQWAISVCLLVLLIIAVISDCDQVVRQKRKGVESVVRQWAIADNKFAVYGEFPVNVKPAANSLSLAPDLSRITDKDFIRLSETDMELLTKNGYVVLPSNHY